MIGIVEYWMGVCRGIFRCIFCGVLKITFELPAKP